MKLLYTRRQVKNLITENHDLKATLTEKQEFIDINIEIMGNLRTILGAKDLESIIERAIEVMRVQQLLYEKLLSFDLGKKK